MATGPRLVIPLVVALLAIPLAAPALAGAGTAADSPTVGVADASVDVGATGRVPVSLSRVPDGLSGFEINVSVGDGSVANVVGASYPSSFGLTSTTTNGDNTTVTVKAVDLENNTRPGDTEVRLASVHVTGQADGTTDLAVRVVRLDDDFGGKIRPATDPGTATVGDGGPGSTATATERTTTSDRDANGGGGGSGSGGSGGESGEATASDTPTAGSTATRTIRPTATERTTTGPNATGGGAPASNATETSRTTEGSTTSGGSTPLRTDSPTTPATATTGTPGQPGFGAPVALVVLLGTGALAARRR